MGFPVTVQVKNSSGAIVSNYPLYRRNATGTWWEPVQMDSDDIGLDADTPGSNLVNLEFDAEQHRWLLPDFPYVEKDKPVYFFLSTDAVGGKTFSTGTPFPSTIRAGMEVIALFQGAEDAYPITDGEVILSDGTGRLWPLLMYSELPYPSFWPDGTVWPYTEIKAAMLAKGVSYTLSAMCDDNGEMAGWLVVGPTQSYNMIEVREAPEDGKQYARQNKGWEEIVPAGVTGVKGDSETTYRNGDVNITPANIGALPRTAGSTVPLTGLLYTNIPGTEGTEGLKPLFRWLNSGQNLGPLQGMGNGGVAALFGGESFNPVLQRLRDNQLFPCSYGDVYGEPTSPSQEDCALFADENIHLSVRWQSGGPSRRGITMEGVNTSNRGSWIPGHDNAQDLGTSALRWRTAYLGTLNLGAQPKANNFLVANAIGNVSALASQPNRVLGMDGTGLPTLLTYEDTRTLIEAEPEWHRDSGQIDWPGTAATVIQYAVTGDFVTMTVQVQIPPGQVGQVINLGWIIDDYEFLQPRTPVYGALHCGMTTPNPPNLAGIAHPFKINTDGETTLMRGVQMSANPTMIYGTFTYLKRP